MNVFSRLFALRSNHFVRDLATMQVGSGIYMVFSLAANIVFARMLGPDEFGLYAVVLAFVATVRAFTNIGHGTAFQVFFAEQFGKRDRLGMAGVLKGFWSLNAVNAVILVCLALLAPTLTAYVYGNDSMGGYAAALFLFSIIDIGNAGTITVLQAVRRIKMKTTLEQGQNISFLTLAMVLLTMGYGLPGLIGAQLFVSASMLCVSFILFRRVSRELSLPTFAEMFRAPKQYVSQYFRQSLLFSVDKNIGGLYPSGLFFVLSLVAQPYAVGLAKIALRLASVPASFLLPQVNELSTTVLANMSGDRMLMRKAAAKVIKHALAVHAAISVAALVTLPLVVGLYGERYASAMPIALWLIVLGLFAPLTVVNSPLLRLFRKVHYSFATTTFTLLLMWCAVYALGDLIGPIKSFLFAYLIGQLTPLMLTAYIFLVLLKRQPRHA